MRRRCLLFAFVFIMATAPIFAGTVYYVDATNGSDANDGLTPEKSWKTINKVNHSIFLPGDSVLFKQGETWREQLTVPSSGGAGSPITLGAYGTTGANPIILGSTNKDAAGDWTDEGGNLWYASGITLDSNVVWKDDARLTMVATKVGLDAAGKWWMDGPNDRVYVYSTANPTTGGATFELGQRDNAIVGAGATSYITVDGIEAHYTNKSAIDAATNQTHWTVQNCVISHCRGNGIKLVNSSGHIIRRNTISYTGYFDNADTTEVAGIFACQLDAPLIDGNTVHHTCRAGILLYGKFQDGSVVQYNTVYSPGEGGDHAYGVEIYGEPGVNGAITNTTIRYNYIHDCPHSNIIFEQEVDGVQIYYNLLTNAGPLAGDFRANITGNSNAGLQVKNLVVYNNILYQDSSHNYPNVRIPSPCAWEGAIFKNNIFYQGGATAQTYQCDITHTVAPTFDRNCHLAQTANFLKPENSATNWAGRPAGFETNGINADPLFVSTVTPDFSLQSTSPCINAGTDVDLTTDYAGNAVPRGATPDIGAYESGSPTTITPPMVTTIVPLTIQSTSATGGGIVTSDGGGNVIDRGVCWSLSINPISSNDHTHDGSGIGEFTSALSNLSPGTIYHVRAYATNSVGTAYGDDLVFKTTGVSSSTISLSRTRLSFGATSSGARTQSQSIIISNSGSGSLNWTAMSQEQWITISQTSGTGTTTINVGVDPSGLTPGTFAGQIAVVAPGASNSPRVINIDLTVYTLDSANIPFGYLDTPQNGSMVFGSVPVTGWALDHIGVESVKIYRDPVGDDQPGASGLIYIGEATFVEGARPDIEQIYPSYPMNYRAGWGLMVLTYGLPNQGNGTFILHAKAVNKVGMQIDLGTKTIICDNMHATKPFGAIDTPVQGGMISGNPYVNFGWVLTPLPNMIPIDGSTLTVWIDGKLVGQPVYNNYRADIATAFPGYANSNGAVGYFNFDTTTYANGVHTIGWSAKDSAGNAEGIGSRFISIYNSGGTVSSKNDGFFSLTGNESDSVSLAELANIPNDAFSPMLVKNGFDAMTETTYMYPEMDGAVRLKIHEVERLEIPLDGQATKNGGEQYCGYLLSGNDMRSLPIGSTLDPINGVFTWQPGPGFLGEYEMVFIKKGTDRMLKKVLIVLIQPKFSH